MLIIIIIIIMNMAKWSDSIIEGFAVATALATTILLDTADTT